MRRKIIITAAQAELTDQARTRLIWVVMCLMMGYLAVGLRLADLTLLRSQSAASFGGSKEVLKPVRGSIVDRNGTLMAASLKMSSVYANTTLVDAPGELAGHLVRILPGQERDVLLKKLSSGKDFVWIQRNITPKQTEAINALGNPALGFREENRRIYPQGSLAAHILGYTDVDGKGIAGIEKFFDGKLAAADEPVRLAIDLRVQHTLHRELEDAVKKFNAKAGIGMVMDVKTGEVIAMVSLPDFDPNHPGDALDGQKFNRATLGVFEMGSTFKIFSTAAALDDGRVRFSDTFDATDPIRHGRFTIADSHPKRRPLTVPEIFIYSSNIGTAKMAADVGGRKLQAFYKKMGFAEPAPIQLPERGAPLYPSPWRDITTLTASFGHGIAVSPLHLIRAASALVNGGIMPQSTLVKTGETDSVSPDTSGERVVSVETSRKMKKLLELVVVNGTGANAFVEGYNVGGKTGTAEKNSSGRYTRSALLSSFFGVFPIQEPRYAVLAMLDEPQGTQDTHGFATGGWTAAPVVARVIEQIGPLYGIPPDMKRGRKEIEKEMGAYLKEFKEGKSVASSGADD